MDYQIIRCSDPEFFVALNILEKRVKRLISQGWKPQGGVSVATTGSTIFVVCQAMVR